MADRTVKLDLGNLRVSGFSSRICCCISFEFSTSLSLTIYGRCVTGLEVTCLSSNISQKMVRKEIFYFIIVLYNCKIIEQFSLLSVTYRFFLIRLNSMLQQVNFICRSQICTSILGQRVMGNLIDGVLSQYSGMVEIIVQSPLIGNRNMQSVRQNCF